MVLVPLRRYSQLNVGAQPFLKTIDFEVFSEAQNKKSKELLQKRVFGAGRNSKRSQSILNVLVRSCHSHDKQRVAFGAILL